MYNVKKFMYSGRKFMCIGDFFILNIKTQFFVYVITINLFAFNFKIV